jgi:hypothetical protein
MLQKYPKNTKQASKGWIIDEDQCQVDLGQVPNPHWKMPRPARMLKLLNNSALVPKMSNHLKKDAKQ